MEEYYRTYGKECVLKYVNQQRNQLGQALRKVHMALARKDHEFTARQLLSVITRNPDLLLIKPTHFKDESAKNVKLAEENKKVNLNNRKHRNRFIIYIDQMIPAVSPQGVWSVEQRRLHCLFCCQHMVADELQT